HPASSSAYLPRAAFKLHRAGPGAPPRKSPPAGATGTPDDTGAEARDPPPFRRRRRSRSGTAAACRLRSCELPSSSSSSSSIGEDEGQDAELDRSTTEEGPVIGISFHSGGMVDKPLPWVIRHLGEIGYDGIEIVCGPQAHIRPDDVTDSQLEVIREELAQAG